jgi:hypothetical protein
VNESFETAIFPLDANLGWHCGKLEAPAVPTIMGLIINLE